MAEQIHTCKERVEIKIREWIMTGRYPEGAWLPSISQLCEQLSVSDKTVKRALLRLKADGLVKGVNGRGLLVSRRQKTVLLLSFRPTRGDWKNMNRDEAALREAVAGWHERIRVLGRAEDSPIGPDLELHAQGELNAADVVVTYGIQNDDYHLKLAALGKPVLALDFCPQRAAVSSVSQASFQAGYMAARHFLDLGHRRIAFLGVRRDVVVSKPERHRVLLPESDTELAEAGYRQALRDAGLDVPVAYVAKDVTLPPPETLIRLVTQAPAPTAVLCWHPLGNFDAGRALREAGLRVPEKIGYCQVISATHPASAAFTGTAVQYDMRPVFALGLKRLKELLEDPEAPPEISQVVPRLRLGDTSGPAPV